MAFHQWRSTSGQRVYCEDLFHEWSESISTNTGTVPGGVCSRRAKPFFGFFSGIVKMGGSFPERWRSLNGRQCILPLTWVHARAHAGQRRGFGYQENPYVRQTVKNDAEIKSFFFCQIRSGGVLWCRVVFCGVVCVALVFRGVFAAPQRFFVFVSWSKWAKLCTEVVIGSVCHAIV